MMILSADLLVEKKGLNKLPQTYFISDLHIKLRIVSRSVAGLATDSACSVWGVWDRG